MVHVDGTVAFGYEPVRSAFEKHFHDGVEVNAQLCVYVGGIKVVDLWGSVRDEKGYDGDSLQTVFSSTKNLTAIAVACLVDRGLLDYGEKVSKYWPEFAQNGKEFIRVEDVLRHESGLHDLNYSFSAAELSRESIKGDNSVGKIVELAEPRYPPESAGTRRQYHAFSRGWILNEIFRRVEPSGRTVGEFLQEEVCGPLRADAYIGGTDENVLKRYHDLISPSISHVLVQSLRPRILGGRFDVGPRDILRMVTLFRRNSKQQVGPTPPAPLKGMTQSLDTLATVTNTVEVRQAEIPSANGGCSARGLARLAACVVAGGELDGVRIMSKAGCDNMHEGFVAAKDVMIHAFTDFSRGGVCRFREHAEENGDDTLFHNSNQDGFIGWGGYGGSVFMWNPEHGGIGFAYVPTRLSWYDMSFGKGGFLQKTVMECAVKAANVKK